MSEEQNHKDLLDVARGDVTRLAGETVDRLSRLKRRVLEKIDDYDDYRFSLLESRALNIFFDIAQERDDVYDLLGLCVIIPNIFFAMEATLYLLNTKNELEWRCSSTRGFNPPDERDEPAFTAEPAEIDGRYVAPIKGNHQLIAQLPFEPRGDVIGLLVVSPAKNLSPHARLFFEKYANRIGFQLHSRIIAQKNREHLQFIHSLVDDIGHNVIVPNMYFKLFYRRLESKIRVLHDLSREFAEFTGDCALGDTQQEGSCRRLQREMDYTYDSLMEQFTEIYRHYEQTSLFLETLLRRGHFEKGHYVLEKRACNVKRQIVDPQVERYRGRLAERNIFLLPPEGALADESISIVADVGLLSQVIANFFSNAVKYARPVKGEDGDLKATVSWAWELLPDHFDAGRDGVRVAVTSSGRPIPREEAASLYTEGFRGANAKGEYGTGHGLHFVREVVKLHGGEVGYEPAPQGNTFFIVLPREPATEA